MGRRGRGGGQRRKGKWAGEEGEVSRRGRGGEEGEVRCEGEVGRKAKKPTVPLMESKKMIALTLKPYANSIGIANLKSLPIGLIEAI